MNFDVTVIYPSSHISRRLHRRLLLARRCSFQALTYLSGKQAQELWKCDRKGCTICTAAVLFLWGSKSTQSWTRKHIYWRLCESRSVKRRKQRLWRRWSGFSFSVRAFTTVLWYQREFFEDGLLGLKECLLADHNWQPEPQPLWKSYAGS